MVIWFRSQTIALLQFPNHFSFSQSVQRVNESTDIIERQLLQLIILLHIQSGFVFALVFLSERLGHSVVQLDTRITFKSLP